MINKILEEMRLVRRNNDYQNYRTLVEVLRDYVKTDIFDVVYSSIFLTDDELKKQYSNIHYIKKWIMSELDYVKELLEENLENKNYKNFKMLSQSDINLRYLNNNLENISKKVNKNFALNGRSLD